jgi:hypothetical protein
VTVLEKGTCEQANNDNTGRTGYAPWKRAKPVNSETVQDSGTPCRAERGGAAGVTAGFDHVNEAE